MYFIVNGPNVANAITARWRWRCFGVAFLLATFGILYFNVNGPNVANAITA